MLEFLNTLLLREIILAKALLSNEEWAESAMQRTWSSEQRAESNKQQAKRNEQRAKSNKNWTERNGQQAKVLLSA